MEGCYICGEVNERVLQRHHLVPRKYGGSDSPENLVTLCANCHQAIEQLYDQRFYTRLKYAFQQRERGDETGEYERVVEIDQSAETGLYRCPICGRTANRKGKPFETRKAVEQHIHGSHDSEHSNVVVKREHG